MILLYLLLMTLPPPRPTLFPYTTLFRSVLGLKLPNRLDTTASGFYSLTDDTKRVIEALDQTVTAYAILPSAERSEEHTSELQSHHDLVCRLLLEKKKK